ncbi:MAG: hypothetical protein ACRDI2_20190, partial [Chloroflexota bacterium]
ERVDQLADQRTYRRLSPEERDAMYQQMADDEARDPEYQREMVEWLNAPLGPYRSAGEARE